MSRPIEHFEVVEKRFSNHELEKWFDAMMDGSKSEKKERKELEMVMADSERYGCAIVK